MRVGVDVRVLLDPRQSGIAAACRHLLASLLPLDRSVEYVIVSLGRSRRLSADDRERLSGPNVRFVHRRTPSRLVNAGMAFVGRPKFDRLAGRVDRCYFPHVLFAAVSSGCPYVVTVHDLAFRRVPALHSFRSRLWHRSLRVGRLLRGAARVITPSEHTRRDVIGLYAVPPHRVRVIRFGIPSIASASPDSSRLIVQRGVREPFFLSLGSLERRKNVLGTIEAFEYAARRLPAEYALVFAGGPGWSPVRGFAKRLARSSVRDRILVLGQVNEEEKGALLRSATATLYPSNYEGFGFPILESFVAGTPAVASSRSALPEVSADAAITVNPDDVAELSAAMVALTADPALRTRLIEAGRREAEGYSWQRAAEQTLDAITSAV